MLTTYKAILQGDQLEWEVEPPPEAADASRFGWRSEYARCPVAKTTIRDVDTAAHYWRSSPATNH